MPFRAQFDDCFIQVRTDVAAHPDHHGFAILCFVALFEVLYEVGSHADNARLGTHDFFQGCPSRFQASLSLLFFVFGEFVDLFIQRHQIGLFQFELGQARLVIDGHGGTILFGLLHVVDMDVVAEDGARVAIGAADGCAREGHKGGVWQRIPQVLGVTHLIGDRGFCDRQRGGHINTQIIVRSQLTVFVGAEGFAFASLQLGFETVLRAVGFVRNHNDIAAVRQDREGVLIFSRHELLDGSEDDAA